MVEKVRFDPAGAKGHHLDIPVPELHVEASGIAEHKGLGGAVHTDIGYRLEGGKGIHLHDAAAPGHIGQGQLGDAHQRLAVQVDHVQVVLQGDLVVPPEASKAAGVHQKGDIGTAALQLGLKGGEAFLPQQVQGQDVQRHGNLLLQGLQPVPASGDHPDLVDIAPLGSHFDKLPAHTGGRAGDDGSIHKADSFFACFSAFYHIFHKKKTKNLSNNFRTSVCIYRTNVLYCTHQSKQVFGTEVMEMKKHGQRMELAGGLSLLWLAMASDGGSIGVLPLLVLAGLSVGLILLGDMFTRPRRKYRTARRQAAGSLSPRPGTGTFGLTDIPRAA